MRFTIICTLQLSEINQRPVDVFVQRSSTVAPGSNEAAHENANKDTDN
jgi:hypothetical protein